MITTLLYASIVLSGITLSVIGFIAFLIWKQRSYFERIMTYGDGLANIHETKKAMLTEHHLLTETMMIEQTSEIIRHIVLVIRWQKAIITMIKMGIPVIEPKETPEEQVKEAEALHEFGLDVAKDAFDDKEAAQIVVDDAAAWEKESRDNTRQKNSHE